MPVFAPDGGAALVLARGFAVAFLLSAFGTAVFRVFVMPPVFAAMSPRGIDVVEHSLLRWMRLSLVLAGLGLAAWSVTLTAYLAGPETARAWAVSAGEVLADTSFGHIWWLQMLLSAAAGAMLSRNPGVTRWRIALAFAGVSVLAQVGHGHAYAMAKGPSYLEISEILHLLAAGAWLGALLPLLMVVYFTPPPVAAIAARRFSPLGKVCVALLAVSATVQAWTLVGSTKALLHTAYGWTALLKLGFFGVLLCCAALNRYAFTPALLGMDPGLARRRLIRSLALEAGFGLLIVLAAALLSQLLPGMDMGMGMRG